MALLLWLTALGSYRAQQVAQRPAAMAMAVQQKLEAANNELNKALGDTAFLQAVRYGRLAENQYRKAAALPFSIAAYLNDSLLFWNDNALLPPPEKTPDTTGHLVFLNNKYCIRKTFFYPGGYRIAALLPVKAEYPFENQYLQTGFDRLPQLPGATQIYTGEQKAALPVKSSTGWVWLRLDFPTDKDNSILPDARTIAATAAALLLSLVWLQLLLLNCAKRKGWKRGLWLTLVALLVLRIALEAFPLPFHLRDLELFSPAIYGYNRLLPSLGDLFLNELCIVWILIYLLAETPYKIYWRRVRSEWLRHFAAAVLLCLFVVVFYLLFTVLHSLVIDSQIVFDLGHFHTIDVYTVIGLITIGIGLIITEMTLRFTKGLLDQLIPVWWVRQLLITGACSLFVILFARESVLMFAAIAWMTVYMVLLDLRRKETGEILSLPMIFLSFLTCISATVILHDLIRIRDLEKDRIAYARHLLARQDPQMEYNFRGTGQRIGADTQVQSFLRHPSESSRRQLSRRLSIRYFNLLINRYQPELYFYDTARLGLLNPDTTGMAQLNDQFENGMPTEDDFLVFTEAAEGGNYLARIPLSGARELYISFGLKKNINETIYPELLQPATVNHLEKDTRYSYALYAKGRRITQTSNYNFPAAIDTEGGIRQPQITKIRSGFYELRYQEAPDYTVIVAGSTGSWLSAAVLLSYLFGVHLALSLIALGYRLLLRLGIRRQAKPYHFTLRQRVHMGTLAMLLISFVLLGMVTIAFFNDRYTQTNRTEIHKTTQAIERYLHQYLAAQGGLASEAALDSIAATAEFRYALYTVTASQKIDANVYGLNGRLLAASQEDIYRQGLLSPVIQPLAFRRLQAGSFITEVNEEIGSFRFLSCCMPLRNEEGRILGYISIPFFSSQKELDDQVSNFVVALIILYAVLFFLSSFLAYFISTRLTRTFNVLINQFSRLNLRKNERIEWPYNDEIGLLVAEYNKMAQKVEENAASMAQTEREGAWREMAQQVAHEIKNPLTPMKLNIQFLQQALKSGRPGVEALAERVSASIIEQIDNLSYIASEFSNFAALPEAKAEVFALDELVRKAAPLYHGRENIAISLKLPQAPLLVMADYSQLLRVFTNLMQNALQSVPEGRQGEITVTLDTAGSNALLAIKDNGTGIDKETTQRIFKPYFTTKSSGTGLGLAMSRKIIELWKGSIWFESEEGQGTTFFIKIPLDQAH